MNIVLGGGGSAQDEADVLAHFASLVHRGRVLNLPWAQPDPAEPRIHQWVEQRLCPLGVREVKTVAEVSAEAVRLDDSIDGIFIGGGNTFRLLARLRSTGVARGTGRARKSRPSLLRRKCGSGHLGSTPWDLHAPRPQ